MYFDTKPCEICGSDVALEARQRSTDTGTKAGTEGRSDVAGEADATVDRRVCSNPDCPTHRPASGEDHSSSRAHRP